MNHLLTMRVKRNNGVAGWLAAGVRPTTGEVRFGYSKVRNGDRYNEDMGRHIAINRVYGAEKLKIPTSFEKVFSGFKNRAIKYFKDKTVVG
jgi:hypothetical protein